MHFSGIYLQMKNFPGFFIFLMFQFPELTYLKSSQSANCLIKVVFRSFYLN